MTNDDCGKHNFHLSSHFRELQEIKRRQTSSYSWLMMVLVLFKKNFFLSFYFTWIKQRVVINHVDSNSIEELIEYWKIARRRVKMMKKM